VREPGCGDCRGLFGYTVVDGDERVVGEVWQARATQGHPEGPHFGFDWKAQLADGTAVTGPWSRYRTVVDDAFCSRGWALAMMGRQIASASRKS
jgi:hypothetical protein